MPFRTYPMGAAATSTASVVAGPAGLLIRVQPNESIVIGEGTTQVSRFGWNLPKGPLFAIQQQDLRNWKSVHTWAERRLRCHLRCEVEWAQYKQIARTSSREAALLARLEQWLLTAENSLNLSLSNGEFPPLEESTFHGSAPLRHLVQLPLCYVALRRALVHGTEFEAVFDQVLSRVTEWLFDALSLADAMLKIHLLSRGAGYGRDN